MIMRYAMRDRCITLNYAVLQFVVEGLEFTWVSRVLGLGFRNQSLLVGFNALGFRLEDLRFRGSG